MEAARVFVINSVNSMQGPGSYNFHVLARYWCQSVCAGVVAPQGAKRATCLLRTEHVGDRDICLSHRRAQSGLVMQCAKLASCLVGQQELDD